MWVYFNGDCGYNKRGDVVDIEVEAARELIELNIVQPISDPHEILDRQTEDSER